MNTIYFLILYNRNEQELVDIQEITDRIEAVEKYNSLERDYTDDPKMEIVLLGAASRSAIEATHSRYFFRHNKDKKESPSSVAHDAPDELSVLAKPFEAIRGLGAL